MTSSLILIILHILVIIANCTLYDLKNINPYQTYRHHHNFCTCNNTVNFLNVTNITEIYANVEYSYSNYSILKLYVNNCTLNIDTDFFNQYSYSYDLNSFYYLKGFSFICPAQGYLYLNISGNFTVYSAPMKVSTAVFFNISTNGLIYNYTQTGPSGVYFRYECPGINITLTLNSTGYPIDYHVDNYLSYNDGTLSSTNKITISNNGNSSCMLDLLFAYQTDIYLSNYTSNVLFYNGTSIYQKEYLIKNDSTIEYLDGYYSTVPSRIRLQQLSIDEEFLVYQDMLNKVLNNEDISTYFITNNTDILGLFNPMLISKQQDILINISIGYIDLANKTVYSNSTYYVYEKFPYDNSTYYINSTNFIVIDNGITYYNPDNIIKINNYNYINISGGIISLTGVSQPILLDNSTILINDNNITINNLTVNNGLTVMSSVNDTTLTVRECADFNGNLTTNTTITINYNCIKNKFNNIVLISNGKPVDSCAEYSNTSLQVILGSCGTGGASDNNVNNINFYLTIFVPIGVALLITILVVITLLNNKMRKIVFPHRDRTTWLASESKTKPMA